MVLENPCLVKRNNNALEIVSVCNDIDCTTRDDAESRVLTFGPGKQAAAAVPAFAGPRTLGKDHCSLVKVFSMRVFSSVWYT